jgi:hypothetical protein
MIDTGTCAGPDTNLCHEYVFSHPPTIEKSGGNSGTNFLANLLQRILPSNLSIKPLPKSILP